MNATASADKFTSGRSNSSNNNGGEKKAKRAFTYNEKQNILDSKHYDVVGCEMTINRWIREKYIISAVIEAGHGNKRKLVSLHIDILWTTM